MGKGLMRRSAILIALFVILIVGVYSLNNIVNGLEKEDAAIEAIALRQAFLAEGIFATATYLSYDQNDAIRRNLSDKIKAFDQGLKLLLEGGVLPPQILSYLHIDTIHPAPPEVQDQIKSILSLWRQVRERLDAISSSSNAQMTAEALAEDRRTLLDELNRLQAVLAEHAVGKTAWWRRVRSATLIAGTVFAFLVGLLISRGIVRPLKNLLSFVKALAEDTLDLTQRLPVKSRDELGYLSAAFNHFIEFLRRSFWDTFCTFRDSAVQMSAVEDQVRRSSSVFKEMHEELSRGSKDIDEIAASVQEANSGIAEIAAASEGLARMAEELNAAAAEIGERAASGQSALEEVRKSILTMRDQGHGVAQSTEAVTEKASLIQDVVKAITAIADRTNLLALNAAIEAARAGEHGKGFAVVAEEVRKLAEESRRAAVQIGENLNAVMEEVEGNAKEIASMAEEMDSVAKRSDRVIEEIAAVLKGIASVGTSAEGVASSAEELSASTEEMSAASEQIASRTSDLKEIMERVTHTAKTMEGSLVSLSEETKRVVNLSRAMLDKFSRFKLAQKEDFIAEVEGALEAHKRWVKRLKAVTSGDEAFSFVQTDPTRCHFGVFYAISIPPQEIAALWEEIGKIHEIVHKSALPAIEAVSRRDFDAAKAMYGRAEEASRKLTALMERCLAICKGEAPLEAPTGLRALPVTASASAADSKVAQAFASRP
ncbi:methyl-accepting chemotaxis protein [Acetomicrobium sp. S15 = DSM 107314]|uniref:methyl-accepting chemotaxis protein n=1 Tax=Acetomicrobium sp. S15 = DSM 107314 TaxID=2529858 RepID=UPI0018E0FDDB|nr:methyl-accepting chemotaxis protein [Acetomicrobium sp. S15 = DSM 107314]